MSPAPLQATEPYVGARPYELEDGPLFFGRERELRELTSLLVAERIVLLHSPSGAGKTSLIRPKLIDHLVGREFDVLPIIRVRLSQGGDAARTPSRQRTDTSVVRLRPWSRAGSRLRTEPWTRPRTSRMRSTLACPASSRRSNAARTGCGMCAVSTAIPTPC